jgi:phosphoribosylglycinamide formyltransferase-1
MSSTIRLGVIGSSGGSALVSASICLKLAGKSIEWVVVTDRECGLEAWAKINAKFMRRIGYGDAEGFSEEANQIFQDADCEDILLFYTRRVAAPLIDQKRVSNIHPSLLPAFGGLHGVRDAFAAGSRVIGATLHQVDAGLDTGRIVAQVAAPLPPQLTLREAEHISYLQKVWLTLVWFDRLASPHVLVDMDTISNEVSAASPGLADDVLRASYVGFLNQDKKLPSQ